MSMAASGATLPLENETSIIIRKAGNGELNNRMLVVLSSLFPKTVKIREFGTQPACLVERCFFTSVYLFPDQPICLFFIKRPVKNGLFSALG
jgi:hypothetical protein